MEFDTSRDSIFSGKHPRHGCRQLDVNIFWRFNNDSTMKLIKHLLARLAVASSTALLSLSAAAQFQAFPPPKAPPTLVMPRLSIVEPFVASYAPFRVVATFTKPYCINTAPDGFADVTLKGNVLNVQLSHLSAKGCTLVSEFTTTLPGLPAGSYQIRVAVAARNGAALSVPIQYVEIDAYEAEAGQTTLAVMTRAGEWLLGMCTAGSSSNATSNISVIQLMTFGTCSSIFGNVAALEVGTFIGKRAGTFLAWQFSSDVPPAPFVPLYLLTYPTGFAGTYATTSSAICIQYAAAWANPASTCTTPVAYVLQATSGACPLGSSPVWQVFQTNPVAHRYTQIASTYTMLVNAGNAGEGVVWCAPARE